MWRCMYVLELTEEEAEEMKIGLRTLIELAEAIGNPSESSLFTGILHKIERAMESKKTLP